MASEHSQETSIHDSEHATEERPESEVSEESSESDDSSGHHNTEDHDGVLNASAFLDQQMCGYSICGFQLCSGYLELATHKRFLFVLGLLGILEGAIQGYFHAFLHDNSIHISPMIISWLMFTNGLIQIFFAFLIGFIGARSHKPTWIANTTFLMSLSSILICFVLFAYDWTKYKNNFSQKDTALCGLRSDLNQFAFSRHWILVLFFFILQSGIGLSHVSYMSLGLSYLDDNIGPWRSPIFIGAASAARYVGLQIGRTVLSWNVLFEVPLYFVFSSVVWLLAGLALLGLSMFLTMFPNKLLPLHDNDAQVPLSNNRIHQSAYDNAKGFMGSLERILSTRMIIYNALASMCLHTVEINFSSIRSSYLQTVFYIPSSLDFFTSIKNRLIADYLHIPALAIVLVFSGYLIKKRRPIATKIAGYNIVAVTVAICIIFGTILLKCQRTRLYSNYGHSLNDYCNSNCHCESLSFLPVCSPDGSTMYYSPCHAGCRQLFTDLRADLYGSCRCVATEKASNAYCHKDFCLLKSIAYQILDLIVSALLISCRVGSMLLCFRCVNSKDKPVVVSLEIFLSMLFAFFPGKYLYSWVLDVSCVLPDDSMQHGCKVYNGDNLSTFVNLLNICFLVAGIGFYAVVYKSVGHISLFGEEVQDPPVRQVSTSEAEQKPTNGTSYPQKSILVKPPKLPVGKDADIFVNCNSPELEPLFLNINEKPAQTSPVAPARDFDVDSNSDRSSGITLRKGGFLTTLL